ncbi:MAG: hypothetical protein K6E19_05615 [Lachnospiraceae bacterium]|nr:hypothetical protein [Lachnospiraceae bacterium]
MSDPVATPTTQQTNEQTMGQQTSFSQRFINSGRSGGSIGPAPVQTVKESVPYGSENGGLLSWFKKKFGKNESVDLEEDEDDDDLELESISSEDSEDSEDSDDEWDQTAVWDDEEDTDLELEDLDEEDDDGFTDEEIVDVTPETRRKDKDEIEIIDIETHTPEHREHQGVLDLAADIMKDVKEGLIFDHEDGTEYAALKVALTELTSALSQSIPDRKGKPNEFRKAGFTVNFWYRQGIIHCKNYISHIDGKKLSKIKDYGKRRYAQVSAMLPMLEKELYWMSSFIQGSDESYKGKAFNDVLFEARSESFKMGEGNIEEIRDASSVVYKKTGEDGSASYITLEEKYSMDDTRTGHAASYRNATKGKSFFDLAWDFFDSKEDLKEKYKLHDVEDVVRKLATEPEYCISFRKKEDTEDPEAYKTAKLNEYREKGIYFEKYLPELAAHIKEPGSAALLEACADYQIYVAKESSDIATAKNARIKPGSVLSDRNVSSSILAKNLGMSDIIAESKTVMLEKEDGTKVRGNSMAEAKGKPISVIEADAKKEQERINHGDPTSTKTVRVVYTPKVVKQIQMLNIFDMISGQVNRNPNNFMFTYEVNEDDNGYQVWYLTSVTGIDNKMSFGNMTGADLQAQSVGQFLNPFYIEGNESMVMNTIRYLPKEFYHRIMAYSPEKAGFDQSHLRSTEEIDAFKSRLRYVQDELSRRVGIVEKNTELRLKNETPDEKALEYELKFGITLTERDEEDMIEYQKMVDSGGASINDAGDDDAQLALRSKMDASGYLKWALMH